MEKRGNVEREQPTPESDAEHAAAVERQAGSAPGGDRSIESIGSLNQPDESGDDYVLTTFPSPIGWSVAQLRVQAERIVANWVLRVTNLPTFRAIPELSLAEVQGVIPDLLDACFTAALIPDADIDPEPLARVAELAYQHGRKRAEAGFPIRVVLTEYQELRSEVWTMLFRTVEMSHDAPPVELMARVNTILDAALIAAAEAWSDASNAPRAPMTAAS